jgi:hypothetical protein
MAVKGDRRAFISTLDSPLRPTELKWERSETKFSEASFLRGLGFSFPLSERLQSRLDQGSLVIFRVNSVRPNHLSDHNSDHDYFFELPWVRERGVPISVAVIYFTP